MFIPERPLDPPIEWEQEPTCPVCHRVCGRVFRDQWGAICGCDMCGEWELAADVEECLE